MQPRRNDENDPSMPGVVWITNKPLWGSEGTRSFLLVRKPLIFLETSRGTVIRTNCRTMCILLRMMVLFVKLQLPLEKRKKATLWSSMKSLFLFSILLLCYFSSGSVSLLSVVPNRARWIFRHRNQYRRKSRRRPAQSMNRLPVLSWVRSENATRERKHSF